MEAVSSMGCTVCCTWSNRSSKASRAGVNLRSVRVCHAYHFSLEFGTSVHGRLSKKRKSWLDLSPCDLSNRYPLRSRPYSWEHSDPNTGPKVRLDICPRLGYEAFQ
jgi:hypothetical protein